MNESFETPVSELSQSESRVAESPRGGLAGLGDTRSDTAGPRRIHGKFAPALAGSINLGGRGSLEISDVGITAIGYRTFGGLVTFLVVFVCWFAVLVALMTGMMLSGNDDPLSINVATYVGLFFLGMMIIKFPKIRFGRKPHTHRFNWENVRFTVAADNNPKELIITIDGAQDGVQKGALRFRGDSSIYQFDADLRALRAKALEDAGLPQDLPYL